MGGGSVAAIFSTFLTSCGAFQGEAVTNFTTTGSKAPQVVQDLLQARQTTYNEEKFSFDSYQFINPNLYKYHPQLIKQIDATDGCIVTDDKNKLSIVELGKELDLQKDRLTALDKLKDYIDQLNTYLQPSATVATADALIDAANGIAGQLGAQYGAVAGPAAAGLKAAINAADEAKRAAALSKLVQSRSTYVRRISSNLERAVRPINDEIDARINTWEVCEFEKLKYIRQQDDVPLIQLEARYRQFFDVKAKLRAQIEGAIAAEELFKKLPALHDQIIIAAKDPLNNFAEMRKIAAYIKDAVDQFHSAILAAKGMKT